MTQASFQLKKKQYLYAGLAGAAGLGLMSILIWSMDDKGPTLPAEPAKETQITTAGQRINPQEIWVERMEGENNLTQQKLDALEKLMLTNVKSTGEAEDKVHLLAQELEDLRGQKSLEGMAQSVQTEIPSHHHFLLSLMLRYLKESHIKVCLEAAFVRLS